MLRLAAQGLGLATDGVDKAQLLDAVEQRLERGAAGRQAHAADRRRGAESAGLGAGRAAHALQLPARRPGAAADLPARPARVPRQARRRRGLEQLRQRVIATHHLEPMDADEVEPYLVHRLAWSAGRAIRASPPTPSPRSTATAAACRARSTSSPTALLLHARGGASSRRSTPTRSRRSPPTWRRPPASASARPPSAAATESGAAAALAAPRRSRRRSRAAAEPVAPIRELDQRIAALEARVEEQDAALRRVLTLLVDWVENGQPATGAHRTARRLSAEGAMRNALSVDVEDWFQVGAFEKVIARDDWDGLDAPRRAQHRCGARPVRRGGRQGDLLHARLGRRAPSRR